MNNTEFTKGEWYVHPNGIGCGGMAIVSVIKGNIINNTEDDANLNLIAAAPKMYKELQRILDKLNHESKTVTIVDVIRIENLLKEARGK